MQAACSLGGRGFILVLTRATPAREEMDYGSTQTQSIAGAA